MTISPELQQIVDAIRARQRFVHLLARPARRRFDRLPARRWRTRCARSARRSTVVNADPAPPPLMAFPGVPDIEIADRVEGEFDAADHHGVRRSDADRRRRARSVFRHQHRPSPRQHRRTARSTGSTRAPPRAARWSSISSRALGVPLSLEIATHIYLAILTDTGSFHYSSISPRTFDICRETLEAGVDPVLVARNVYDSNNMGRLKLFGAVLSAMQIDPTGRIAIVYLDHEMARAGRRHLRGHRRAHQPAADGEGDPGGRVLQAGRRRRVPRQHALEGRHRHRRGRQGIRRRRPQERGRLHGHGPDRRAAEAVRRAKIERERIDGRPAHHRQARGPTSHDVVARVRRALGERRIGHTGTLDPAATGVLPLVRRPRHAARAVPERERQVATTPSIRLGFATDTGDADGAPVGPAYQGALPSRDAIDAALDAFRGTFLQQPPAYSAKKIDGTRSYTPGARARTATLQPCRRTAPRLPRARLPTSRPSAAPALPAPVAASPRTRSTSSAVDGDRVTLRVDCSAGFYVRVARARSRRTARHRRASRGAAPHAKRRRHARSGASPSTRSSASRRRGLRALVPLSRDAAGAVASVTLTERRASAAPCTAAISARRPTGARRRVAGSAGNRPYLRQAARSGRATWSAIAEPAGASGLLHPSVVLM